MMIYERQWVKATAAAAIRWSPFWLSVNALRLNGWFLVGSTIIGVNLRNYRCCRDTDHWPISYRGLALMRHQPLALRLSDPSDRNGQVIISPASISNDFGCVRMCGRGRQALDISNGRRWYRLEPFATKGDNKTHEIISCLSWVFNR